MARLDEITTYEDPHCVGCKYYSAAHPKMCMYWDMVGKLRPCPPGKLCTVKVMSETRKNKMKLYEPEREKKPKTTWNMEDAFRCYCNGMTLREIATEFGVKYRTVCSYSSNHRWFEKRNGVNVQKK